MPAPRALPTPPPSLHRAATPLVGLLKPQFGTVADLVTSLILVSGRGSDQMRLRALREVVAQIRAQLEISTTKVKEQHEVVAKPDGETPGSTS